MNNNYLTCIVGVGYSNSSLISASLWQFLLLLQRDKITESRVLFKRSSYHKLKLFHMENFEMMRVPPNTLPSGLSLAKATAINLKPP